MAPKAIDRELETLTESNSTGKKLEILYDGYFYDVTDFVNRHPGGNVIKYYTEQGEDATQAIQQFHNRVINKIHLMLKQFKKRPATDAEIPMDPEKLRRHRAMTHDFAKLFVEIQKEGLFSPSYIHVAYRITEIVGLTTLGLYIFGLGSSNILVNLLACLIAGIGYARCGYFMHEGGHRSLTGNPKIDKILTSVFIGVPLGLTAGWWNRRHNKHHAMPQRLHYDVDLNTMPLIAHNVKVVKNPKEGQSFFIQNQVWLFLSIDCFIGYLVWRFYDAPRKAFREGDYFDLSMLAIHYYLMFYMPFPTLPYLIMTNYLGSTYIFCHFVLNHSDRPVTEEPGTHWLEYGLTHTNNVRSSLLVDWWMGYLNFQIEHHLFPTLPQFRCHLVKDRVKALAKEYNLPYQDMGYFEAWRSALSNFDHVAKEFR